MILAINVVLGLVAPVDNYLLMGVWYLVNFVISAIIALGLIRAALAILDGRTPQLDELLGSEDLVSYIIASILVGVIVTVGFILCIVPGMIAGFLLQFFGYAIVDDKTGSATEAADPIGALRASFEVTSHNVGNLIMLLLVAFLVNLAGALLCGVGLLVSIPVTVIAVAYAWRFFTGGVIAPQNA